jgi:hypothetical protein
MNEIIFSVKENTIVQAHVSTASDSTSQVTQQLKNLNVNETSQAQTVRKGAADQED